MKAKLQTYLTLVLIVILGLTNQAIAGGDYYSGAGSVKDYGGTPVPAPIPVPMYDPVWYFRADLGFGFGDGPSASEEGIVYGEPTGNFVPEHTFYPNAGDSTGDFDQAVNFGVGVGFRWSERFRTDLTGESRRAERVRTIGRSSVDLEPDPANGIDSGRVVGATDDEMHIKGGLVLFNAYYDMPTRWGGFTPYIGGGLGFAVSQIDRRNRTTETAYWRDGTTNNSRTLHS